MRIPLILIGYRATGKSTLARLLGEKLGFSVLDSDEMIETRCGKTIARIFAEEGETVFRSKEADTIADILDSSPEGIVLSTGGGAILRESNRIRMKKTGFVVWLDASAETIHQRMLGDATNESRRPNLTNLPPFEEIVRLLRTRKPLYEETSHLKIDSDSASPESLAAQIADSYHAYSVYTVSCDKLVDSLTI